MTTGRRSLLKDGFAGGDEPYGHLPNQSVGLSCGNNDRRHRRVGGDLGQSKIDRFDRRPGPDVLGRQHDRNQLLPGPWVHESREECGEHTGGYRDEVGGTEAGPSPAFRTIPMHSVL